jgi:Kef-type K+ transport system membrane component KefB
MAVEFTNLAVVAAVAFGVPLLLGLVPWLRVPSLVLELIAGIVIGPHVLGLAEVDQAVQVMSMVGVAFLLLLAGLEIDFRALRGEVLRLTVVGFAVSFAIALAVGYGLQGAGLLDAGFLAAIVLAATGLGIIVPIMKDTGTISTTFGQVVIAGASIAEIGTIVLLSLFYGESEAGLGSRLVLFGGFVAFLVVVGLVILGAEHVHRVSGALLRFMDTTAQIRVRGAVLLLALLVAAASGLGLEAILGAFLAGVILKVTDRDAMMTHTGFHHKLEAVGFGAFIPFFFVASGLRFDVDALFASSSTIAMIPIFLVALLAARGVPALLYRKLIQGRQILPAALLQATSVSFILVATSIGVELGTISEGTAAAFVAAGLLSVLLFPLGALGLLRRSDAAEPLPGAVSLPSSPS